MKRIVSGTFNGTGADLYLCLGFIPDWFEAWTAETTDEERIRWSINSRSLEMISGYSIDDDGAAAPDAFGTSIAIYRGGDYISSASTTYLVRDPNPDKRASGTGDVIDTWTLGNSANRTGNWNAECNTSYVGEGSRINIDGKWYTVLALTSNGEQANEVTLSEAAPSGEIQALTGMYDFLGASAGIITPAGIFMDSTCTVNSNGELCFFEAGCYH